MDLLHIQSSCGLNCYGFLLLLLLFPRVGESTHGPLSYVSSYSRFPRQAWVPIVTMSPSPLPISRSSLYHLLCRSCSTSSQLFFQEEFSICGCTLLVCPWEQVSSASSHATILDWPQQDIILVGNFHFLNHFKYILTLPFGVQSFC